MAHLVAYRNRTNISGQHSNERISVHGGRHPNVRIFGSFAGSSTADAALHTKGLWRKAVRTYDRPRPEIRELSDSGYQSRKFSYMYLMTVITGAVAKDVEEGTRRM